MSKICDRQYGSANLLSVKVIKGVQCCPSCNQPAQCHGKNIERRALFWALAGDTGVSSEAIARHMTGGEGGKFGMMPPSDADDRGRCIRLLELIPEWLPRLKEMAQFYDKEKSDDFVINSSGISAYHNSWSRQIPLIIQEGKF